jgi:hypothetical protein
MELTGRIKSLLKRYPIVVGLYYSARLRFNEFKSPEDIFSHVHDINEWGDAESVSGTGSNLRQTQKLRRELPALLKDINAKTLLDAPCGDLNWMKELSLPIERYIGVDVVTKIVEENQRRYTSERRRFLQLDITKDPLPAADVILCRDCLVHLSHKKIEAAISQFKQSRATYLLTTTFPHIEKNKNIGTGGWRPINLEKPPFNFSPPLHVIVEESDTAYPDKTLALWKLKEL